MSKSLTKVKVRLDKRTKKLLKGEFLLNLTHDCLYASIPLSPKQISEKLLRVFAEQRRTLTLSEAAEIAFGDDFDPDSLTTPINVSQLL